MNGWLIWMVVGHPIWRDWRDCHDLSDLFPFLGVAITCTLQCTRLGLDRCCAVREIKMK